MKVKLSFDSKDEFAEFILSASSIRFESKFQQMKKGGCLHRFPDFLELVCEIEVEEVRYSVAKASFGQEAKYKIFNYMLNIEQIKYDAVHFVNDRGENREGSQNTQGLLMRLPESFVLRIGWVTDYEEFVFKKL